MRVHRSIAGRLLLLAAILVGGLWAGGALAQDPRATAAQSAAVAWLALVDTGEADASWAAAGQKFRAALDLAKWHEALEKARAPFGKTLSRAAISTRIEINPKDAPEGEYAAILFDSSFENAARAGESVTMERESDGTWRVIGYVIR